jgi:putative aminopeptidase FrvX
MLFSCGTQENKEVKLNSDSVEQERNNQYFINVINKDISVYIAAEAVGDTVFISKFKDSLVSKLKLHDKVITSRVKETIKYQLEIKNFYNNDANTLHSGKSVRFYIENSNNRLEAKYNEVEHYKEISLKFDSLITELIKADNKAKEYFVN